MFVVSSVLAHDCFKVASNIKQILAILPASAVPGETFVQTVCRVAAGIWHVQVALNHEATTATPYFLRDTILFSPIYQMITDRSQNNAHAHPHHL
jgi:vacuolar-type H+-ATPase catalytic subunit A/Vma1